MMSLPRLSLTGTPTGALQTEQLAGAYLLTVAGIAAVVFVAAGLSPLLTASARDETSRALAATVRPAGILMAASIVVGGFAIAGCSATAKFDGVAVDPAAARFLPSLGYDAVLVGGGLAGVFLPMVALPLWVLLASVTFLFSGRGAVLVPAS